MKISKLIIVLFFLLSNESNAQLPSYVPTSGLKGWWSFTGNPNDISGNNNNGIVYNANLTTDRFDASNSAYSFNGTTSYVGIPTIDLSTSNKLTISVWINPINITSNEHNHIMRQDDGLGGLDWLLAFQNYGTNISFGLNSGGNYSELDIPISASDYINTWHHIVAVYDGSSRLLYKDNILIGSDSKTGNVSYTPTATFGFGAPCACPAGVEKFNGKIDDVGIWGSALSSTDITSLYNSTSTGIIKSKSMKIDVTPNPTSHSIEIDGLSIEMNNKAMIYSIHGQLLKSIPTIENAEIDLSDFNSGVYLIKINDVTHRVVKL